MSYTVRYLPDAEQELAALWIDSSKRAAVTRAVHHIDQQLQQAPEELGESRPFDCRIHLKRLSPSFFVCGSRINSSKWFIYGNSTECGVDRIDCIG